MGTILPWRPAPRPAARPQDPRNGKKQALPQLSECQVGVGDSLGMVVEPGDGLVTVETAAEVPVQRRHR